MLERKLKPGQGTRMSAVKGKVQFSLEWSGKGNTERGSLWAKPEVGKGVHGSRREHFRKGPEERVCPVGSRARRSVWLEQSWGESDRSGQGDWGQRVDPCGHFRTLALPLSETLEGPELRWGMFWSDLAFVRISLAAIQPNNRSRQTSSKAPVVTQWKARLTWARV